MKFLKGIHDMKKIIIIPMHKVIIINTIINEIKTVLDQWKISHVNETNLDNVFVI
jgi:hypothetical protein